MNRIGPIQLFAEIKRRDNCVTYRGVDNDSGQIVLVKVFQPANAPDEAALVRFHQEAAIYARLNHPNVVKLIKFGVAASRPYLALEFIEGQNLRALLSQRSPLPNDIAICITLSMLAGLEEIHRHEIIHRDLKPENIMIGNDGAVKICDFDLARTRSEEHVASANQPLPADNLLFGSPGYFSPEAILGEPVTPRSDLFAAGIVLYEMFAGARPFMAPTTSGEMNAVIRLAPLSPAKLNDTMPREIEPLINRLLAKSPQERPESAAVILNELKEKFPDRESRQKAQALQRFLEDPARYQNLGLERPFITPVTPAIHRSIFTWRIAAVIAITVSMAMFIYQYLLMPAREPPKNSLATPSVSSSRQPAMLSRTDSLLQVLHRITLFDSMAPRPEGFKIEDIVVVDSTTADTFFSKAK